MYSPLVAEWDQLIRSGAERRTVVDLYADPSQDIITVSDIKWETWSITDDRKSGIRRSGNIKITDPDVVAEIIQGGSALEPYGSELRISSGFVLPNGTSVLVPMGVFSIEDLSWNEDEDSVQVQMFDRAQALQRNSYGTHLDASGMQAESFIQSAVDEILPYAAFISTVPDGHNFRFPGGTTYRAGRLQAVQEAAEAMGAEFYFDVNGTARIVELPYIDELTELSDYDWLVNSGSDGVLISYGRSITRKDTYNKIHVLGAPATQNTPQPYSFAVDSDPASPTYYGGRFGKVDLRIERQELTTDGQCNTYALAQLRNSRGLSKSLDFHSLSNPALEAGDKVRVDFPDGSVELHLVDSVKFDESGGMAIATRVRQVA